MAFARYLPIFMMPLPGNTLFYQQQALSLPNPPWSEEGYIPIHSLHGSLTGEGGMLGSFSTDRALNVDSTITET